jgi:hypothetical protein
MTTGSVISEQLRRRSVVAVECTIPAELTIEQWRRRRRRGPKRYEPRLIESAEARHGLALRDAA